VEVEGISGPCKETDDEVQPILETELSEEADGVLQRLRLLPFAVLLAIVVPDNDSLVPDEQIPEGLLSSRDSALCQRVGRSVGARHRY
jgi:hypothetical protein